MLAVLRSEHGLATGSTCQRPTDDADKQAPNPVSGDGEATSTVSLDDGFVSQVHHDNRWGNIPKSTISKISKIKLYVDSYV